MKKGLIGCLVVVAVLLVVGVLMGSILVSSYNHMVTEREAVDRSWAQVQNVLQRRGDLIPNLVETVKGYASHEREVFEQVAEARSRLAGASTPQEASQANAGMTSALSRLLAIAENYPQLKANENFIRLQDELAGSENRIATERMRFNEAVRTYNTLIKRFPNNLIAGFFNFGEKEYFEASAEAREVPKVKF
ncbi:MAG TPA: LemA family protein [Candidatus Cryosericum sp.]|nr:LemA family protein [Candidatus Cryosericum sp.]